MGRESRPFCKALAAVAKRRGLTPNDMIVEMIGDCAFFQGRSVQQDIDDLGLAQMVRLGGWVPHSEAQERIQNADVLLLLAEGQPQQVPNKLYEYLGSRRPLLVFADPEG